VNDADCDLVRVGHGFEELHQPSDNHAQVGFAAFEWTRTGETQELVEQTLKAFRLASQNVNLQQTTTPGVLGMNAQVLEILPQELEIDHHRGKGISQLMG
jgi:hypothetical protein